MRRRWGDRRRRRIGRTLGAVAAVTVLVLGSIIVASNPLGLRLSLGPLAFGSDEDEGPPLPWPGDPTLAGLGRLLGVPVLTAPLPPVGSTVLGVEALPAEMPAMYAQKAQADERPLEEALAAWHAALGVAPDEARAAAASDLPRDAQIAVACVLYAMTDATHLQAQTASAIDPETYGILLSAPARIMDIQGGLDSPETIDELADVLAAASTVDMRNIEAAARIVSETVSFVLPTLTHWAAAERDAHVQGAEVRSGLEALHASAARMDALDPIDRLDVFAQAVETTASWVGVHVTPAPVLQPTGPTPLRDAILGLAGDAGVEMAPAALENALDSADGLPLPLQHALARVLVNQAAYAETLAVASGDTARAAEEASRSAVAAQLRVIGAVRASAPTLEVWGLYLSHQAVAMMPKTPQSAWTAPVGLAAMGSIVAAPEAGVSHAVAQAAYLNGMGFASPQAPPLPPRGDLGAAVLQLYEYVGVTPDAESEAALASAVGALPEPVERNAARVLRAQLDAMEAIDDVAASLDAEELRVWSQMADGAVLAAALASPKVPLDVVGDLRTFYASYDRVAAVYFSGSLHVAAAMDAAAADLAAYAAAHGPPPAGGHDAADTDAGRGLLSWVPRINFIGTASAQGDPPSQVACRDVDPLVTDCDNDVWFMDPVLQTVVVGGFDRTEYDPSRIGLAPVLEVDEDIPFGQQTIVRFIGQGQIATIDLGGDDVYRNNAGGAYPELVQATPGNPRAADPTWLAVALDIHGDDAYEAPPPEFRAMGIQGSGVGGVGLLLDVAGDDTYAATERAQGFGAAGVAGEREDAPCDRNPASQTTLAECLLLPFGLGVLVDQAGNDRYASQHLSQGAGGRLAVSIEIPAEGVLPPAFGGTGILVDHAGSDRYFLTGTDAVGQGGGDAGMGVLVDAAGNDQYHGGRQGGSENLGLGILVDLDGSDRYSAVRSDGGQRFNNECGTSLTPRHGDPRELDPSRDPVGPAYPAVGELAAGVGVYADTQPGVPCSFPLGTLGTELVDSDALDGSPESDSDADGWPDAFESVVTGTWNQSDPQDYPAGRPSAVPPLPTGPTVPGGAGHILRIPGVFILGDAIRTEYDSEAPHKVIVDLGGADHYGGSVGAAFGLSLDVGDGNDEYVGDRETQGHNGLLIDLMGDDTYKAQEEAQAVAAGGSMVPVVAGLFDASGMDTYEIGSSSSLAAQGAVADRTDANVLGSGGLLASIAVFLDADGDDTYASPSQGVVLGRGAGTDAGVFLDLAGEDTYAPIRDQGVVRSATPGGLDTTTLPGQAVAVFSDNAGDDTYRGRVGDPERPDFSSVRNDRYRVSAIGASQDDAGSVGVFWDQDLTRNEGSTSPVLLDLPNAGVHIGAPGPDAYLRDYALIIDTGGADRYHNNAGGTLFRTPEPAAGGAGAEASSGSRRPMPVASVVVDLGPQGDVYDAESLEAAVVKLDDTPEEETVGRSGILAQGAGFLGVGLLVDEAGDDAYRARGLSQGFGMLGFGLLWDREGQDTYSIVTDTVRDPVRAGGLSVWPEFRDGLWTLRGQTPAGQNFNAVPEEDMRGSFTEPDVAAGRYAFSWRSPESPVWKAVVATTNAGGVDDDFPVSQFDSNQRNVRLTDSHVYWEDDRAGDVDLWRRSTDPQAGTDGFLLAGGPGDQVNIDVWDDTVVWQDSGDGPWQVRSMDLDVLGVVRDVSAEAGDLVGQENTNPRVSPAFLVWQTRSTDGDWDIVVVNRLDASEPFRVLELPGDQTDPDVEGGQILFLNHGQDGDAPQLVAYDYASDEPKVVADDVLGFQLDREDPGFAAIRARPPESASPTEPVASPYQDAMVIDLDDATAQPLSTTRDQPNSRMVQGAAWQAGAGLLFEEAGSDRYVADSHAQGAAFSLDEPNEGYPGSIEEAPSNDDPGHAVVGVLVDLDGNDVYRALQASQGAHYGAEQRTPVIASNPFGGNAIPATYFETAANGGLLFDLRGYDRYEANRHSQGFAGFMVAATAVDLGQEPGGVPSVSRPQEYLVASAGVLLDLGHQDEYVYGQEDAINPWEARGNRQDHTWTQRPRGPPDEDLVDGFSAIGGMGADNAFIDKLEPHMRSLAEARYQASLKLPDTLPLQETVTIEVVVEQTDGTAPALPAGLDNTVWMLELKRVELLADGHLVGQAAAPSECADPCAVPILWDTDDGTVPDGEYQLTGRAQFGFPFQGAPVAVTDDEKRVAVDNLPKFFSTSVSPTRFSPTPFDRDALSSADVSFSVSGDPTFGGDSRVRVSVRLGLAEVPDPDLTGGYQTFDGPGTASWSPDTNVPSGEYTILIEATDRPGPNPPSDRIVTRTHLVTVDRDPPTAGCIHLGAAGECNPERMIINTRSGTVNTALQSVAADVLFTSGGQALGADVARAHLFERDDEGSWSKTTIEDPHGLWSLEFKHPQTKEAVVLLEDDVGNVECPAGCAPPGPAQQGEPSYLDVLHGLKVPNDVARFPVDLVAPVLQVDAKPLLVDGTAGTLTAVHRVGAGSVVEISFVASDPTEHPVTGVVKWASVDRPDDPVTFEMVQDGPDPEDGLFHYQWSAWSDVAEDFSDDIEGLVLLEFTARDAFGNEGPNFQGLFLLDRTAPTVTSSDVLYPAGRFHAEPGDDVTIVVQANDPLVPGGSPLPATDLVGTLDASDVTTTEGASSVAFSFDASEARFVAEDLLIEPPEELGAAKMDSTVFLLPLRFEDTVGNVCDGADGCADAHVAFVLGQPNLDLTLVQESVAARDATLTWSTARPTDAFLEYWLDDPTDAVRVDPEDAGPALEHAFVLSGLEPGTLYSYQVVASDPAADGAREAAVGFTVRTALGLGVAITSPASEATLSGAHPVAVEASMEAFGGQPPRLRLWLENPALPNGEQLLADETPAGGRLEMDLVTDALPDGVYQLRAEASFGGESITVVRQDLTIDNTPPAVTFLDPTDEELRPTFPSSIRLQVADASTPVAPDATRLWIDGVPLEPASIVFAPDDAEGRAGELRLEGLPAVTSGQVRVSVAVEDAAGNTNSSFVRVLFDPDAPQVSGAVAEYAAGQSAVRPGQWIGVRLQLDDSLSPLRASLDASPLGGEPEIDLRQVGQEFVTEVAVGQDVPDGVYEILVSFQDRLGNNATTTVEVTVDALPPQVTSWSLMPLARDEALLILYATEPISGDVTLEGADGLPRLFDVHGGEAARQVLTEVGLSLPASAGDAGVVRLAPLADGEAVDLSATLHDRAGHELAWAERIMFAPVLVEPPSVEQVVPAVTRAGVQLGWTLGDELPAGAVRFQVFRASDGVFDRVGTVFESPFVDADVTPDTTYRYFVNAVNLAGRTGPSSAPADVFVPPVPTILEAGVLPTTGRATDVFRFHVELQDMRTPRPTAWLLLNDVPLPMRALDADPDCRDACVYAYEDLLAPLDVELPEYTFHVEVTDGTVMIRHPEQGSLAGPVVLAGRADAGPSDSDFGSAIPGPSLLAALGVAGLVALGLRMRRTIP